MTSESVLLDRVNRLESLLHGSENKRYTDPVSLADRLKAVDTRMNAALFKKPRILTALKQSDDFQKYKKLSLNQDMPPPDTSVVEFLAGFETKLNEMVVMLEKIDHLKKNLESQHMHECRDLSSRLASLANEVHKARDQEDEFASNFCFIISEYNTVVELLSQQIIVIDRLITKLEKKEQE